MREKGTEESGLPHITVSEVLIPGVESSFLWIANIEASPLITPSAAG